MMRREREITDHGQITAILDQGKVVHLGLCEDGWPYVVPMNYGWTETDGRLRLYVHGAREGYKYAVLAKNPRVAFSVETEIIPFGGELPCQYGTGYACVMGRGTARDVTDVEEKKQALTILMKTQTGKDFTFTDALTTVVRVLCIEVDSYMAKRRPLPPGKAPRQEDPHA